MDDKIIEKLSEITEEERAVLSGKAIDKSIYTGSRGFTVESGRIFRGEQLVGARTHTRFAPFPRHRHNYIELIYMCKGTTTHVINSTQVIELHEGEMLLLGVNAVHEVKPAGKGDIAVNFIIKPEFFTVTMDVVGYGNTIYNFIMTELSERGTASFMLFDVSAVPSIGNLIENLVYSMLIENSDNYSKQSLTMSVLFMELADRSESISSDVSSGYEQEIVLKAVSYIENSFKDAKLTDLADKLHVPVVALSKTVKKYSGTTFKSMLQKKRLQEAEKLIRNTDIPITEIIFSVGYENTNFFYKLFAEKFGCSPKEYRRAHSSARRPV